MMMRIAVCVALAMAACSCGRKRGSGAVPPELKDIQGSWRFDEERYLAEHRAQSKSEEEFQKVKSVLQRTERMGAPVMSSISVEGRRIITKGGLLQQQFDLLECRRNGGRIVCRALWHEDRHDPGDASVIDLVISVSGNDLTMQLGDGPGEVPFFFRRDE